MKVLILCPMTTTVAGVRALAAAALCVHQSHVRVSHRGKRLSNNITLADANMQNGATIHVQILLRGGVRCLPT